MKKLLLAALCASTFTLIACDKKPTDDASSGSNSKPAATVAALSTNNIADIKNDFSILQSLSTTKAKEALDFQTEVMQAAQGGDKEALKAVVDKMKIYVESFNNDLNGLAIKSTEVVALREKMKEANKLGVEMAELGVSDSPNPQKIMELQKKATEAQQSLLTDMQEIQTKINTTH